VRQNRRYERRGLWVEIWSRQAEGGNEVNDYFNRAGREISPKDEEMEFSTRH
jgi:hypothetical protein